MIINGQLPSNSDNKCKFGFSRDVIVSIFLGLTYQSDFIPFFNSVFFDIFLCPLENFFPFLVVVSFSLPNNNEIFLKLIKFLCNQMNFITRFFTLIAVWSLAALLVSLRFRLLSTDSGTAGSFLEASAFGFGTAFLLSTEKN